MDPRIHDSDLVGIKIANSRREGVDPSILLSFQSEDGQNFGAELKSVLAFRCDNFRQGNVVLEMIEALPEDVSQQEIEHLRQVRSGESIEETRRISKLLESGEYKFVRLESSYGADFWAICKTVEFDASYT